MTFFVCIAVILVLPQGSLAPYLWGMNPRQPENLFRQNAIDSLARKFDGRPISIMPRPWLWLAALCLVFVVGAGCFLWSAEYSRKETVRGWLVSVPGVVHLSHSDYATVARVERKPGDVVRLGDPMVLLSSVAKLGNGQDPTQQILDRLQEQLSGTDKRDQLAREQFLSDHQALEIQIAGLDKELSSVSSQQRGQDGRVQRSSDTQESLQAAFERGAIAKLDLLEQQDVLAVMQQSVSRLRQETTALERERQGLLAAQEQLGIEFERSLAKLSAERSELQQRIAQHERQHLVTLQAPIDGTIATVEVTAGSTIRPQQLLATIIPEQSTLTADVYVPSSAAGMIRPGQTVRLLYDAFPYQQFGAASGQVDGVAGFVSLPGDMPVAARLGEAGYKVTVTIESDYVEGKRGHYALRPGMALAAEIVLESRSLAHWLLAPLQARF